MKKNYIHFTSRIGKYNWASPSEESMQIFMHIPETLKYEFDNKTQLSLGSGYQEDFGVENYTCEDAAEAIEEYYNGLMYASDMKGKLELAAKLRKVNAYNEYLKTQYRLEIAKTALQKAQEEFANALITNHELPSWWELVDEQGEVYYRVGRHGYYGNASDLFEAFNNYETQEELYDVIELKEKYDLVPKEKKE